MGTIRRFKLGLSETLQPKPYTSVKVEWEEATEFDEDVLPKGVTSDSVRQSFIERVREEFAKRRQQAIQDFITTNSQVKDGNSR